MSASQRKSSVPVSDSSDSVNSPTRRRSSDGGLGAEFGLPLIVQ